MSNDRLEGAHSSSGTAGTAAQALEEQWATDPRWAGVDRTYTARDVIRLRGSIQEEHTLARVGAERLWSLLRPTRTWPGRRTRTRACTR